MARYLVRITIDVEGHAFMAVVDADDLDHLDDVVFEKFGKCKYIEIVKEEQ